MYFPFLFNLPCMAPNAMRLIRHADASVMMYTPNIHFTPNDIVVS